MLKSRKKKFLARFVGLTVAGSVSTAKIRFTSWWGESFSLPPIQGVIMIAKNLFAPFEGLTVAEVVSATKIRFAPKRVNHSQNPQI